MMDYPTKSMHKLAVPNCWIYENEDPVFFCSATWEKTGSSKNRIRISDGRMDPYAYFGVPPNSFAWKRLKKPFRILFFFRKKSVFGVWIGGWGATFHCLGHHNEDTTEFWKETDDILLWPLNKGGTLTSILMIFLSLAARCLKISNPFSFTTPQGWVSFCFFVLGICSTLPPWWEVAVKN